MFHTSRSRTSRIVLPAHARSRHDRWRGSLVEDRSLADARHQQHVWQAWRATTWGRDRVSWLDPRFAQVSTREAQLMAEVSAYWASVWPLWGPVPEDLDRALGEELLLLQRLVRLRPEGARTWQEYVGEAGPILEWLVASGRVEGRLWQGHWLPPGVWATVFTPANSTAWNTVWAGTVNAGDIIRLTKNVTYVSNTTLLAAKGVSTPIYIETEDWATNFTTGVRANIGATTNHATIYSADSTGGADAPIQGGLGSWYIFRAIRLTSEIGAGTRRPGTLAYIGETPNVNALSASAEGKANFHHGLFDGPLIGDSGHLILGHTQGLVVEDSDMLAKVPPGSEQKCITSNNGYGPYTIRNTRLRNASISILFADGPVGTPGVHKLLEAPNSAPGSVFEYNYFHNENHANQDLMKNLTEFKSAENVTIRYNRYNGSWSGLQRGQAINLAWGTGGSESRTNKNHEIHHNSINNCEMFYNTGGDAGSLQQFFNIHDNLALVGYHTRTGAASLNYAIQLSNALSVTMAHNTIIGNVASRKLGLGVLIGTGENAAAGFVSRDNVIAQPVALLYTLRGVSLVAEAGLTELCGVGGWLWTKNLMAFSPGEATNVYPTIYPGDYIVADQAAIDALINTTTYAVTDLTKVSAVDGRVVGADIAALTARIAGVEAGTPTDLTIATVGRAVFGANRPMIGPNGRPIIVA